MKKLLKESIILFLLLVPHIYLAIIWEKLPDTVATHFNFKGEADEWNQKSFLLYMPGIILLAIYLTMLLLPKLDPKGKITQMGEKYDTLRLVLQLLLAILNIFMLNSMLEGQINNPNMLIGLIGALMAFLGNYFQALRPNYFIGIRTPWTLENEKVWRKTHQLAGKYWVIGGLLILLLSIIIHTSLYFAILSGIVFGVMVLVPILYSYKEYQRQKKEPIT